MKFENALNELEKIAKKLEEPSTSLEEGLQLFNNSIKFADECAKKLKESQGKVQEIRLEMGQIIKEDFNV